MQQEQTPMWKIALYIGAPAGVLFGLLQFVFSRETIVAAVVEGVFFAVFFGFAMAWFVKSRIVARQTAIELPPGETVEYEGAANHFLNGESRGGRLYLTNQRLIFQPHKFNLQGSQAVISRGDIAGASPYLTFGVVPNGLSVKRREGTEDRFVVSGRSEWLRRLVPA